MQDELENLAAAQGRKHQSTGMNARTIGSGQQGLSPPPGQQTKAFADEMDCLATQSISIKLEKKNQNRKRGKTSNGHDYEEYLK